MPENDQSHNESKNESTRKITVKEVKMQFRKTPNKAPGDSVFPQHLKMGTEKLFQLLTSLFNASFDLGYFADKWKISTISMILKPDKSAALPSSYRPISLLPIIGKLFERILTVRLTLYMEQNGLVNKFQCGFRKKKSTVHQLIRLAEHIYKWYNKIQGAAQCQFT